MGPRYMPAKYSESAVVKLDSTNPFPTTSAIIITVSINGIGINKYKTPDNKCLFVTDCRTPSHAS